jgi:hypothetical protein
MLRDSDDEKVFVVILIKNKSKSNPTNVVTDTNYFDNFSIIESNYLHVMISKLIYFYTEKIINTRLETIRSLDMNYKYFEPILNYY